MVILRVTSILGGQKENKGMMCSITPLSEETVGSRDPSFPQHANTDRRFYYERSAKENN
jgi:hypothetical protein